MNLRFVEADDWVVTLTSVTRAAEKLHLTQPAVSSRIESLEQELGTLLLDRRDKHLRVTIAGQCCFGHAKRLLALQRDTKAELGALAGAPILLRLGAFELVEAIRSYFFQNLTCVCRAGCESLQQPGAVICLNPPARP